MNVSRDDVVKDDAVPLEDVAKMLNVVDYDELDVQVDDCIYPADEVLLLNDDIIKDDDVLWWDEDDVHRWVLHEIDERDEDVLLHHWCQIDVVHYDGPEAVIDDDVVGDGIVDDGINDAEVFGDDARWQILSDVVDDNVILLHVDVVMADEAITLLMCDVPVVDVLDDDVVVGLFPLDEMRPVGSTSGWTRMYDVQCFPLMQYNKDDVEVVVNDEFTEDEVFANEDTGDGQDERGLNVLLIDHDVLHADDVLLWFVHWCYSMMTLQG